MRASRTICTFAAIALLQAGCSNTTLYTLAPSTKHMSAETTQALTTVKVGMTREQVVQLLGEPDDRITVGATELLRYRPAPAVKAAVYYSPIGIVDGKVAGIGPAYEYQVTAAVSK